MTDPASIEALQAERSLQVERQASCDVLRHALRLLTTNPSILCNDPALFHDLHAALHAVEPRIPPLPTEETKP